MEDGRGADLYGISRRLLEDGDYNAFDIDRIVYMLSLPGTPSLGDFLIDSGISPYAVDEVCLNIDNMGDLPIFESNPCKNASFWEKKYRSNYQPLVFKPDLDDRVSRKRREFFRMYGDKFGRPKDKAEKQKRRDLAELYVWRSICFTAYRKARRDIVRIFYKLLKKFRPLWLLLETDSDTPLYQNLERELDNRIREIIYSGILIEPGAAVNKEYNGETCLTIAAKLSNAKLFKMLLRAGAIPNRMVRSVAREFASNNQIRRMLRKEAEKKNNIRMENPVYEPKRVGSEYKRTFRKAIDDGDTETVIEILKKFPEEYGYVNQPITGSDSTPLMYAVFRLKTEIVRVLLAQKGIDVNRQNYQYETALIVASSLKKLRPGKVPISLMEAQLKTQMMSRQEEIVRMLLDTPFINVNIRDQDDRAAVYYAISDNNNRVAKMLINAPGADLDMLFSRDLDMLFSRNHRTLSLVHLANEKGNKTIIRQLFRRGASTRLGYIDDIWLYRDETYDIAESNIKENAEWGSIF